MFSKTRKNERGQAALLLTLGIVLMFGIVGLSVDVGWAYYAHLSAHAAAESAALAAAQAALETGGSPLKCGSHGVVCNSSPAACGSSTASPPGTNMDTACLYAQSNGFVTAGNQSVTMQSGLGSAPTVVGVTSSYWVAVRATQSIPQLFSAVMGNTSLTPTARATAAIVPLTGTGGCIYVLDPAAQNAFVASGSASVTAPCGMYVDSSNTKALQVTGGASLNANPSSINVVGGDQGSNSNIHPLATTGAPSFADPLANIPAPTWSGCDHTTQVSVSGVAQALNPGVYCGGISVNGGANVTFNSGTYILNGGGLTVSGGTTSVTGAGVTFFDTGDVTHAFGPISLTGGGTTTLSAPTSGPLNNMLFFQDRNQGNSSVQNAISGGTTANLTGALYFPTTKLVYSGGSSTNSGSVAIVADLLEFSGPSFLKDGLAGANGVGTGSRVALIE